MDDDDNIERLRRRTAHYRHPRLGPAGAVRTAEYIRRIQSDTASLIGAVEDPDTLDNAGPAYLRSRAAHYRELATQQRDPKRAQLFRDLAASFEQHAVAKERRAPP